LEGTQYAEDKGCKMRGGVADKVEEEVDEGKNELEPNMDE
jgi:hypothetical protein